MTAQAQIEQWLGEQAALDTLRFITCGSVDDGKSTLIGRLLFEAQSLFDDQIATLERDSRKCGTQGDDIDFALLVDGLAAEREQGITIDVAYRFFNTDKRKFIVADTPGHEQYTRNMVTGASTADVALILIDARQGILPQTRRHSFICSLLGIRHVLVAVNKMDLCGYRREVFEEIDEAYRRFAEDLNFASITTVPISALKGDNVVARSVGTVWYQGPTLLGYLETVAPRSAQHPLPMRFPVQWVNRPHLDFRGYSGTLAAGAVTPGQAVRVLPSGAQAEVKDIVLFDQHLDAAQAGQSVTLTLDREVDASRGDVLVAADAPCEVSDQFDVTLVWMDESPGFAGRSYQLKLGTQTVTAQISSIKYRYNVNTFEHMSAQRLELNDISEVTLSLDRPIVFEPYTDCAQMGGFILIDRMTHGTIAAGMIRFALRRASNVHRHKLVVDKQARRQLNAHSSRVLWLTGLSGSGKSTLADALEQALHARGVRTYILDGDNVRHGLNKDLGFTDADRVENIRRIAEVARLMVDAGIVVITAFISPFRAEREMARSLFEDGEFVEIFVDTPLEVAEQRDPKGLYKKARAGDIPNFTGISSPYEPPLQPEYHVQTAEQSVEDSVQTLLSKMEF